MWWLSWSVIFFDLCATQFKYFVEWFIQDSKSTWHCCKSASFDGIPLCNHLCISHEKLSLLIVNHHHQWSERCTTFLTIVSVFDHHGILKMLGGSKRM